MLTAERPFSFPSLPRRGGRGNGRGGVKALALTVALTGTLAGCMLGPNYQRPAVDAPSAFRFDDKAARDLVNTAWWEQFKDPVLNDLLKTALAENKDVKIAAARVEEFFGERDRKSTRLNSSHVTTSRMPSSA